MPKRKRSRKYTARPKVAKSTQPVSEGFRQTRTVGTERIEINIWGELKRIGILTGIILLILLILFLAWR